MENCLIHSFLKTINAVWNSNSLVKDLISGRRVYFQGRKPLYLRHTIYGSNRSVWKLLALDSEEHLKPFNYAQAVLVLSKGCITWTLTKRKENIKLDENYTKM